MIVNDNMIAAETSVTMVRPKVNVSVVTSPPLGNVRTECPRACSDFNVLHGLRRS